MSTQKHIPQGAKFATPPVAADFNGPMQQFTSAAADVGTAIRAGDMSIRSEETPTK